MSKGLADLNRIKEIATVVAVALGLTAVGVSGQIGFEARNCRTLPYELGGHPAPFTTRVCDHDGDGTTESTSLLSVGPGYTNSQSRESTQKEIDWYRSQV